MRPNRFCQTKKNKAASIAALMNIKKYTHGSNGTTTSQADGIAAVNRTQTHPFSVVKFACSVLMNNKPT